VLLVLPHRLLQLVQEVLRDGHEVVHGVVHPVAEHIDGLPKGAVLLRAENRGVLGGGAGVQTDGLVARQKIVESMLAPQVLQSLLALQREE
jgi:hypothetical protein